jgi:hypothetical protein
MNRLLPLILLVAVAACSGAGRVTETETRPESAARMDTVVAETFDITPYRDEPAEVPTDPEHDVPAPLMDNRADAGIEVTLDGFRVQVFSTLEEAEAAAAEEAARALWEETIAAAEPGAQLPADLQVYRLFRQPYYRIRVGDFTDRAEADRVALLFASRFEGALVVPDQVTVHK